LDIGVRNSNFSDMESEKILD